MYTKQNQKQSKLRKRETFYLRETTSEASRKTIPKILHSVKLSEIHNRISVFCGTLDGILSNIISISAENMSDIVNSC